MWVKLVSSTVNKETGYYIVNYTVSDDISSLTVKVGGTEQSFAKSDNNVEIQIPIVASKGLPTQVLSGTDLIFNIYGVSETPLYNDQKVIIGEYKSLNVATAVEVIDIQTNVEKSTYFDDSKMLEVGSYNSNSKIIDNTEYSRGLNDGLILGQFL